MFYFLYQTRHHENMSMEMYTPFIIPHFYVVWGNLLFLFLLQNIDCGYSFQRVPTIYFLSKNKEILKEIQKNQFLRLEKHVYYMGMFSCQIMFYFQVWEISGFRDRFYRVNARP